jgi:hypothetical protein
MSFWFRQLFGVFNFIANVVAIATVAPPSSLFKKYYRTGLFKKEKRENGHSTGDNFFTITERTAQRYCQSIRGK